MAAPRSSAASGLVRARSALRRRCAAALLAEAALLAAAALLGMGAAGPVGTDLDAFMAQVLARRDENWRKLQQYVLDEHETADVLGTDRTRLFGLVRDYAWYIRDGIFVRSPVRYDGIALSEDERRKYEQQWIAREREREARRSKEKTETAARETPATAPDASSLATLAREPQFVSAAYFLRFRFEPGHYALAGRERLLDHDVYRIEYYPERLFNDDEQHREAKAEDETERRIERQLNKVALVTLWIEPATHQILQYTFDNIGFDFLPGRWLVRVDTIKASMQMVEAFPAVWLPHRIEGRGAASLATGTFEVRYATEYVNYREAAVKARVR
jgi:hypothetical protein